MSKYNGVVDKELHHARNKAAALIDLAARLDEAVKPEPE